MSSGINIDLVRASIYTGVSQKFYNILVHASLWGIYHMTKTA